VYGTVTFAYVPIFWPKEIQNKIGLMESMTAYFKCLIYTFQTGSMLWSPSRFST